MEENNLTNEKSQTNLEGQESMPENSDIDAEQNNIEQEAGQSSEQKAESVADNQSQELPNDDAIVTEKVVDDLQNNTGNPPEISEKIKTLNIILGFVAITKPIIYDKCMKTGFIASSIFSLLGMESDTVKYGNDSVSLDKDDLTAASYLANIGFTGIPEYILYKQGALNEHEFESVKQHARLSANVCSQLFPSAFNVVLYHHELPSGTTFFNNGYFKKMTGVSRSSYIVGIADRFAGSLHMLGTLYRPANSRYDALKNAMEMFDNTSQVFSEDEINAITDLLLGLNI